MKTKFNILFTTVLAVLALAGCTEEIVKPELPVQKITLSDLTKTMKIGQTHQMTAEIEPENHAGDAISWTSSDAQVASIDENGLITALAEGEALISATVANVTAQCALKVTPILVESVTLNKTELELEKLQSFQLEATVLPADATDNTVTWSSSDPESVSVENGLIKALKESSEAVVITATAGGMKATCNVIVLGNEAVLVPTSLALALGQTDVLKITLPQSLRDQAITWTSENAAIATVVPDPQKNNEATVEAVGFGTVNINAQVGEQTLTCEVTVDTKLTINLDNYSSAEEFAAALKDYDAKGVTEYRLTGDFSKSGIGSNGTIAGATNPFRETNAEVIDLSGIQADSWPEVAVVISDSRTETAPGMPAFAFACGKSGSDAKAWFSKLHTVILPEEVEALGTYAFGVNPLKVLKAPGACILGERILVGTKNLNEVHLTTSSAFVHHVDVFKGTPSVENTTLHLNKNKEGEATSKNYLGAPRTGWKAFVFE